MDVQKIIAALARRYDIHNVALSGMEGYDSTNFQVTGTNQKWVLKIYNIGENSLESAKAENDIMRKLAHLKNQFPLPVPDIHGHDISVFTEDGKAFRMLTFLDGTFLAESEHTELLIKSFGTFLGNLDKELYPLHHPQIGSKKIIWDLDHLFDSKELLPFISDSADRKVVAYFLSQWKTFVIDQLPNLRRSIIHNDANDWNVLTNQGKISGLIDFGDMVYSRLIYELTVAAAYLCVDKDDPLQVVFWLVEEYHKVFPLEVKEVDLLYYLIAGRLCTSVLNSAKNKIEKPDSSYITVSERGAWKLLHQWLSISPIMAKKGLRKIIGAELENPKKLNSLRQLHIPSVISLSYRRPIHMVKSAFQYMYDDEGNAILDAYNNIIHVGHCHPHVVAAGQDALATLNTNTRYLYESLVDYADHLLRYFPDKLNKVFFVNSGSAASDLAIRLATTYTQHKKIVVLENGYHGNTNIGISLSHYKYSNKGGSGKHENIIQAPMPDVYRGAYDGEMSGIQFADELIEIIEKAGNQEVAAFLAEPIIGCGGQVPLAPGYLELVYRHIRSLGGLCISDEVQTGFGRLGRWFWGFEMHGVEPDVVILGKPIGNGHPMAAVITTDEIAERFNNGMEFFSSFGGNPVSCAIGNAVLTVIENENLQHNAKTTGDYLKDQLSALSSEFPSIGDIRGEGLFLGIDLIQRGTNKTPDGALAGDMINYLREINILTSLDGPGHNVIKIKPPICFNKMDAALLISGIRTFLEQNK